MTNDKSRTGLWFPLLFELRHQSIIRHSGFVIFWPLKAFGRAKGFTYLERTYIL